MSLARVVLRPHRVEAVGVVIMTVLAFLLAGGLLLRLQAFGIPDECFGNSSGGFGNSSGDLCTTLQPAMNEYRDTVDKWGFFATAALVLLPVVSGVLFGLAIVGKEIDQGTTTFAWSIGPSRRRWLLQRVLVTGAAITLIGLAGGALADLVAQWRDRFTDQNASLALLGIRGPTIGAETLAYFGLSLLVGAVIGRVLPALLLSVVLVVAAFGGTNVLADHFLSNETVFVYYQMDGRTSGRVVDAVFETPEGEIVDWQTAYERYGDEGMSQVDVPGSGFRTVLKVNPPELYPFAVARLVLLFATFGLLSIVLSFAVVERRRPT